MAIRRDADKLFEQAIDGVAVPGVIALAADAGGVVYEGAFGTREIGKDSPMTLDTVFAIASMTKPITAVAAMQLVEQRRIGLDEALGTYLPELTSVQVLDGFDPDGAPRLRPPRRAITLRHLLTHTAGFAYSLWNADLLRFQQHAARPLGLLGSPLVFDPGERWSYGTGSTWAGRLVEQVSGMSLEEYFRRFILDPLGMSDTSFVLRSDQRARLARCHQRLPEGSLQALPVGPPQPVTDYDGGGGLYSTGADYLRFLRMLLSNGQLDGIRVLQPETVAEMARNQIGDVHVEVLHSTIPAASNDVAFFPGTVKKWGFGGLINTEDTLTGRSRGSWAWGGLNNTYFWIDPKRQMTGLILTQILPFCDAAVLDLFANFERLVYTG